MAKQEINIGTVPNDSTCDALRYAFDKINDNTTELYNVGGWGHYVDAETTPATQTISTTPSKLQVDGGGGTSESGYLPYEIRGTSELWDTTNDKITQNMILRMTPSRMIFKTVRKKYINKLYIDVGSLVTGRLHL